MSVDSVLMDRVFSEVYKKKSFQPFEDLFDLCVAGLEVDERVCVDFLKKLSDVCFEVVGRCRDDVLVEAVFELHRKVLCVLGRFDFDSFLLFVEWERDPKAKFYVPRRKQLKIVVDSLQDLADDKLDLLAVSMPPGVGKTTLAIFYLCWLAGKYPNDYMLTASHSDSFVHGVYEECLRIFSKNGEYLWSEVFPHLSVGKTNAKDCRIDLGKPKRFETLQFTSTGSGNAGLYRASKLLYCDDLISKLEEAMNRERLNKLWNTYTTDLRQRKSGESCKELHIATRWSVHDVIGRLEVLHEGNPRARFIRMPALDENDESLFDYQYGVGFSTEYYLDYRETMEEVSWKALYQNQPIEREGLLYSESELRRYFSLPEGEPDAVLSVCDTKDKGVDYCCMPVVYQYGNDFYVEEILCDNSNPEVVEPRLVALLLKHNVQLSRFESNSAGGRVAEKVQELVKSNGGVTHVTTKFTTSNKETKIIVNSPFVKNRFLFKDKSVIRDNPEYRRALGFLCSYNMVGKNKFDDVPDAFSQLSEFCQSLNTPSVEVFKRPF